MYQEPIGSMALRSREVAIRNSMRFKAAEPFDSVTLGMAMMILGQTLLIIALAKL